MEGSTLRRDILAFCAKAYLVLTFPLVVPPLLMLMVATTGSGRLFALACVAGWGGVGLVLRGMRGGGAALRRGALCLVVASLALLCCRARAPGPAPEGPALPASIVRGTGELSRWSPASLVPEVDQFTLGSWFVAALDPFIDVAQSRRLRLHFQDVYREMGVDPTFARLPSSMDLAYRDLFGVPRDLDHTFVYVPAGGGGGSRRPIILFLHGSLGNFQAYLWVLKAVADSTGHAIVAPTYGAGFWSREDRPGRPGWRKRLEQVLDFVRGRPDLDASRIVLAGLSNGGLGVSRGAIEFPDALRGLIYVSPVIEPSRVGGEAFTRAWKGRPVLVLHGEEDDRIPMEYVEEAVAGMKGGGVNVTFRRYVGEEHWLFFSRRKEIAAVVAGWLGGEEVKR